MLRLHNSLVFAWLAAFSAWNVGCEAPVTSRPDAPPPERIQPEPASPAAQVAREPARPIELPSVAGEGDPNVERFARNVVAATSGSSLIGVLPLVYFGPRDVAPKVPALGVEMANLIARRIAASGFGGEVLDPTEMSLNLRDLNVDQVSLLTLSKVMEQGSRLGVDVVVFGTFKHQDGGRGMQQLAFEIVACDVFNRRIVGEREAFLLRDSTDNREALRLLGESSPWTPLASLPETKKGPLRDELSVAVRQLSERVARIGRLREIGIDKAIYIAPTDSSQFVGNIATLRSMQATLSNAITTRQNAARGPNDPDLMKEPVTLGTLEFKDIQAAEAFVRELQEKLFSTESYRFCQSLSADLVERMQPKLDPRQVYKDVGFLSVSNPERFENDLASGGLARSAKIREILREEGVSVVIQPRIEQVGPDFRLRAEIYNLETKSYPLSQSIPIDVRYSADLAAMLEVRDEKDAAVATLQPLASQSQREASWDQVYAEVKSGVVRLEAADGHGTGFVVSSDGLIVTNAHVAQGLPDGPGAWVLFSDGSRSPFKRLHVDARFDIAVVRAERLPTSTFVFKFADQARARVGVDIAVLGQTRDTQGWFFTGGILSSTSEFSDWDGDGNANTPSYMYTAPTRRGNSGSPVLLRDKTVVAVHNEGTPSINVGQQVKQGADGAPQMRDTDIVIASELTGFAKGVPGVEAQRIVESLP